MPAQKASRAKNTVAGCGCIVLITVILLVVVAIKGGSGVKAPPTAAPTPTVVPVQAKRIATALTSLGPQKPQSAAANAAVLGGSLAAFKRRFGTPNGHSAGPLYNWERCSGSNVDQFIVTFDDGRANDILYQSCGHAPSISSERNAANAFFPAQSQLTGTATSDTGKEWRYRSPVLGKQLAPVYFGDCNGKMTLGVFTLAPGPEGWELGAGSCP